MAQDIAFPAGGCRNTLGGGEGIVVTDAQVASFVHEFDNNIYPVESRVFSVPPTRDGKEHGSQQRPREVLRPSVEELPG